MQHDLKSILLAIPLFKSLDTYEVNQLIKLLTRHDYEADDVILEEGAPSERLIVILAGTVSVTKKSGETVTHICDLDAGECLGETGVLEKAPCSANVVAKGSVQVAAISSEGLETYFGSNRVAAIKILRQMVAVLSDRLRKINVSYSSLMTIADNMD